MKFSRNKKIKETDFTVINDLFRITSTDIDSYFSAFYETYIDSVSNVRVIIKKLKKKSIEIETELDKNLEFLNKRVRTFQDKTSEISDKYLSEIEAFYKANHKKLIENDFKYKTFEEFNVYLQESKSWIEFFLASTGSQNFDHFLVQVKNKQKMVRMNSDEITSVTFNLLEWAFKLKHELTMIKKRIDRVYKMKINEMAQLYKKNPSSSTIVNIVDSFDELSEFNKSDYKLVIDSITVDINSFDKRLSSAFNSYRTIKNDIIDSYEKFENDIMFDVFKEGERFYDTLDENKSVVSKLGIIIMELAKYSGDPSLLIKFRNESDAVNTHVKKEWLKFNENIARVGDKLLYSYKFIVDEYFEVTNSTLRINDSIRQAAYEFAKISDIDITLINNVLKYISVE